MQALSRRFPKTSPRSESLGRRLGPHPVSDQEFRNFSVVWTVSWDLRLHLGAGSGSDTRCKLVVFTTVHFEMKS